MQDDMAAGLYPCRPFVFETVRPRVIATIACSGIKMDPVMTEGMLSSGYA